MSHNPKHDKKPSRLLERLNRSFKEEQVIDVPFSDPPPPVKTPQDKFYEWICEKCLAGGTHQYLVDGKCPFCAGQVKKIFHEDK